MTGFTYPSASEWLYKTSSRWSPAYEVMSPRLKMKIISQFSLYCWISDRNSDVFQCIFITMKNEISEETVNVGNTSRCTNIPKTCFIVIMQTHGLIQKSFVRIKDNVYPDDDPSGSIWIFLSLVHTSVCVCMYLCYICLIRENNSVSKLALKR